MKTEELLNLIKIKTIQGIVPDFIEGIQMDSRNVGPGDIFVCITGYTVDGHEFVEDAVRRGASMIVAEKEISHVPDGLSIVRVKDSAKVLARLASHLYGYPAAKLSTIGVTGTNGKTTVSHMIHELMGKAGQKSAVAGTLGQDVRKTKFAVLNQDDSWSASFSRMTPFETINYGLSAGTDFQASQISYDEQGTEFMLESPEGILAVKTAFIGKFNVYNVLAALAALYAYGMEIETMLEHLPEIYPVEGRMEKLASSDGPTVYIDYAHTPDAIEKAIDSLLPFKKGRLIILIAGGNYRD